MISKQIADGLYQIISRQPDRVEEIMERFTALMAVKGLNGLVPSVIARLFSRLKEAQAEGDIRVKISHKLDIQSIAALRRLVDAPAAAGVRMETEPELIGGFKAVFRDKLYDASVRKVLTDLKFAILRNN